MQALESVHLGWNPGSATFLIKPFLYHSVPQFKAPNNALHGTSSQYVLVIIFQLHGGYCFLGAEFTHAFS